MNINKDTKIYGSFSLNAGDNGNIFFNKYFQLYNINAIYKSFSIKNIEDVVKAAKCLNFDGFAVSMPFKKEVIKHLDEITEPVKITNACNTVINKDGKFIGYNTDYLAVREELDFIKKINVNVNHGLVILGDGGMASSAKYAAELLNIEYQIITRENWNDIKKLKNKVILNCTPVENIELDISNTFIDCIPTTEMGKSIHKILAKEQFYLYTGIKINDNE